MDASIKQELEPREPDLDPREFDENEIARTENVENLMKEEQRGELVQTEWVRWEEEELLPEGWRYRWHKQKSLKAKSGFKRSLHFITDAGTKLKSSNEAFKYLVENDFPELDQEKMREFVQSWKNTERRTDEVEVKKETFERAEVVYEEAEKELHNAEDETADVEEEKEVAKKPMTEEEKKEERRARDREGQRRRRALAKARRSKIKEDDPSDDNQSGLEEHVDLAWEIEEERLDEVEDADAKKQESKYEDDPMLPSGWKKATYFLQKNGRALPRFKAPDGTKFGSRAKVDFVFKS